MPRSMGCQPHTSACLAATSVLVEISSLLMPASLHSSCLLHWHCLPPQLEAILVPSGSIADPSPEGQAVSLLCSHSAPLRDRLSPCCVHAVFTLGSPEGQAVSLLCSHSAPLRDRLSPCCVHTWLPLVLLLVSCCPLHASSRLLTRVLGVLQAGSNGILDLTWVLPGINC